MRALLVAVFFCVACADSFDPPSRLSGTRVLAVVVDQPFAAPGATVQLDMLAVSRDGAPLEIAWFGGCENPAGDQPARCLDTIVPTITVGTTHFETTLTSDIISRRPKAPGKTPPYGVAFVYYAVCDGHLVNVDPPRLGFGVDCVDRDSGASLDPEHFVVGYTPIYAYDGITNANPQMAAFDLPDQVARCSAADVDDCPDVDMFLTVEASQVELDYSAVPVGEAPVTELLWASYFATVGEFVSDTRLVADVGGVVRDLDDAKAKWHVDPDYVGPASIYVVLRDNRGGSSWLRRDVLVQ